MAAAEAPLTGLAWVATPEAAPAGWTAITVTVEGAAANLGKGFGHKGGGYLCVSTGGAQAVPGAVVTDVQVLSDRSPQPAGYTRIPEFPEPRTGLSRKKRLYVKLLPPDTAETAVLDVKLSSKSKALPLYMRIGEIGNFAIWCKKGPVLQSSPQPVPKPRTISAGLKQLSLQPPDSDQKSPAARCSIKRASQHESLYDTSNIYGLSAMDGVPFTLHPKFESKLSSGSTAILADLTVKSLADIEKEYDYAFIVERTAAARLPPSVC
ncbi:multivesicular body subunit 12A isoform X2 [Grus americana]|uniref:multivesicular body subunit 12A isoform X2 n=1 Tax=Grus americana TaxID=9117 RepID=UPI0024078A17|nr:multivesicular body subunit 12A isoform X2 [Grus americana]